MSTQVIHGDCINVMRTIPADSVDAIITSPPYAEQRKSTYGGVPEADYPEWTVAWMSEAWRLLKPNGSVIINIRPHLRNGQISDYTLKMRMALRDAGWNECEELIWFKTNPMPNGSSQRPRRAWESLHWFAKHGKPFSDPKANGKPLSREMGVRYGQSGRNGWGHYRNQGTTQPATSRAADVFSSSLGSTTTDHPAPFPTELAEWMGRLICPPDGTILDPFSGSGSTGVAATRNGWNYIGIDAVEEYVEMSRRRLIEESLKETA